MLKEGILVSPCLSVCMFVYRHFICGWIYCSPLEVGIHELKGVMICPTLQKLCQLKHKDSSFRLSPVRASEFLHGSVFNKLSIINCFQLDTVS